MRDVENHETERELVYAPQVIQMTEVMLAAGLTLAHFSAQRKPFWSHLPVSPYPPVL
jgi:hypothetical protein